MSEWLRQGGESTLKTFVLDESYSRLTWVYACVNAIAASIAGTPIVFERGSANTDSSTDREPITDTNDPVLSLFQPPNPPELASLSTLLLRTFVHLGIEGGLYWLFGDKGPNGAFSTIDTRRIGQLRAVRADDGTLIGWVELDPQTGQPRRSYTSAEVLPILYYNPKSRDLPLSPLQAARLTLEGEFFMNAWNAAFFKKGLRNPYALTTKRSLTPKQEKDWLRKINEFSAGVDHGQSGLVVSGGADVKELGLATKDIDFLEGKRLNREEICAIYGVPPAMVGIFQYANYANSEQQRRIFWQNTLIPRINMIEELIQINILDVQFPNTTVRFDLSDVDVLQPDPVLMAKAVKTYFDVGYNRTEIANILGAPELAESLESDEDEEAPPSNPPPNDEEDDEEDDDANTVPLVRPESIRGFELKETNPLVWQRYGAAHFALIRDLEVKWDRTVRHWFGVVARGYERVVRTMNGREAYLDPGVWGDRWAGWIAPQADSVWTLGGAMAAVELQRGAKGPRLADLHMAKAINLADYLQGDELEHFRAAGLAFQNRIVLLGAAEIEAINAAVPALIEQGGTITEIQARIRELITHERYQGQATTIARTQTNAAYNGARTEFFGLKGVKRHRWISAGDQHVRDSHQAENGNETTFGDPFPVTLLRYPHDPSGPAREVINCVIGDTVISHANVERAYRRWYEGPAYSLEFKSGKKLTVTPNHPIATPIGMRAAHALKIGDRVIGYRDNVEGITVRYMNVKRGPTPISEIFAACDLAGFHMLKPGSDLDFHGDGFNSNVEIVTPNSKLVSCTKATISQHFGQNSLIFSGSALRSLQSFRAIIEFLRARLRTATSLIGALGDRSEFAFACSGESQTVGFASSTYGKVEFAQDAYDDITSHRVANRQTQYRFPFAVQSDELIGIEISTFQGHVYNLQANGEGAYYGANGIITGNCRCVIGESVVSHATVERAYQRHYDGPVHRLEFETGEVLTVTPNHPIATRIGMVAAHELKEGDQIIGSRGSDGEALRYLDVVQRPTPIAELFATLAHCAPIMTLPGHSENFHGDGSNRNVDLITVDSQSIDWLELAREQIIKQLEHRITATRRAHIPPTPIGQRFAWALGMITNVTQRLLAAQGTHGYIELSEDPFDGAHIDIAAKSDFLESFPFPIKLKQITRIDQYAFSGHVYNLQANGARAYYVANGIVSGNCTTIATSIGNPSQPSRVTLRDDAASAAALGTQQILNSLSSVWRKLLSGQAPVRAPNIRGGRATSVTRTAPSPDKVAKVRDQLLDADEWTQIATGLKASTEALEVEQVLGKISPVRRRNVIITDRQSGAPKLSKTGQRNLADFLSAHLPARIRTQLTPVKIEKTRGKRTRAKYNADKGAIEIDDLQLRTLVQFMNDPQSAIFSDGAATASGVAAANARAALNALRVVAHEHGHHLDFTIPEVRAFAIQFFRKRTLDKGERIPFNLREGQRATEWALGDKVYDPYQLRVYAWQAPAGAATSVLSESATGIEVVPMFNQAAALLPWNDEFARAFRQLPGDARTHYGDSVAIPLMLDAPGFRDYLQFLHGDF